MAARAGGLRRSAASAAVAWQRRCRVCPMPTRRFERSPTSLPGAAELHLGADAQKRFLQQALRGVPVLHFSTHAIADTRDPDRSRILLAPAAPGGPADYLFLREIYDLDLTGVQLVDAVGLRHRARQSDPRARAWKDSAARCSRRARHRRSRRGGTSSTAPARSS